MCNQRASTARSRLLVGGTARPHTPAHPLRQARRVLQHLQGVLCCAQPWLVGSASLSMRLRDSASKGAVAAVPQLTCPALAQPFAAWPQPVTTQPQPPYSSPAVRAW